MTDKYTKDLERRIIAMEDQVAITDTELASIHLLQASAINFLESIYEVAYNLTLTEDQIKEYKRDVNMKEHTDECTKLLVSLVGSIIGDGPHLAYTWKAVSTVMEELETLVKLSGSDDANEQYNNYRETIEEALTKEVYRDE